MKFSKKRELILNEVVNSKEHPTADNIYEKLKKDNPSLSLGTVYRNLTQLEENGYINRLNIPGDPVRFDGNLKEHDHFICDRCGRIIDISKGAVEYVGDLKDSGMEIRSSYVILRGICDKCNGR